MIDIKCPQAEHSLLLTEMEPFQGELKKRTEQDIAELKASLEREGLLMPFAVWQHEGKNYLLDGHGRRQALLSLIEKEPEVISTKFPVVMVSADTEDDARKALLQITSTYGKITKQGVKQFTVSIPDYVAPSIKKFVPKPVKEVKVKPVSTKTILKIRLDNDKVGQVKDILKQFTWLEIL